MSQRQNVSALVPARPTGAPYFTDPVPLAGADFAAYSDRPDCVSGSYQWTHLDGVTPDAIRGHDLELYIGFQLVMNKYDELRRSVTGKLTRHGFAVVVLPGPWISMAESRAIRPTVMRSPNGKTFITNEWLDSKSVDQLFRAHLFPVDDDNWEEIVLIDPRKRLIGPCKHVELVKYGMCFMRSLNHDMKFVEWNNTCLHEFLNHGMKEVHAKCVVKNERVCYPRTIHVSFLTLL